MIHLTVILNEARKALLIMWDYRFSVIAEFFVMAMLFAGIMLFAGGGDPSPEQLTSALLGILITFYVKDAVSRMSWAIVTEAQAGTLEQLYMGPSSSTFFLMGSVLGSFVVSTVSLLVVAPILIVLFGIEVTLPLASLPIFAITLLGVAGFGFLVAGLTILFKNISVAMDMMLALLFFGNGTFLPVDQLPEWLEAIATMIPSTQGIIALRSVATDGQTLSALWSEGTLVFLTVHSLVFMIGGWLILRWCEDMARQHGSLGHY